LTSVAKFLRFGRGSTLKINKFLFLREKIGGERTHIHTYRERERERERERGRKFNVKKKSPKFNMGNF
jgi:hypothetical protein